MYKKSIKSKNIEDLKRSLQEAEVIRNCASWALRNPSLDPDQRSDYEIAFMRLNTEIRDLKTRIDTVRKNTIP
ncbi:MAG TPA: hypothetical protein VMT12_04430 [Syntrophales bacterium]|nr:hypothetical protein [Syntrophales bacterium]